MAIDTRNKRASILALGGPYLLALPAPDGNINQADRQQAAFSYAGVLADPPIEGIPHVSLLVDGVDQSDLLEQISLSWSIGSRYVLNIDLRDLDGSFVPDIGDSVELYDLDGSLVFPGSIESEAREKYVDGSRAGRNEIPCVGHERILDRFLVSQIYAAGTDLHDIIISMVEEFIPDEEDLLTGGVASGPAQGKMVFPYVYANQVLDQLADISNYRWYVWGRGISYRRRVLTHANAWAYWRFGEPAGSVSAIDSIGGRFATYGASLLVQDGFSLADGDTAFVPPVAGVTVPSGGLNTLTGAFAAVGWVHPSGFTTGQYLFQAPTPARGSLRLVNGIPVAQLRIGGTDRTVSGSGGLALNAWTQVGLIWEGTGGFLRVYTDGVEIGSGGPFTGTTQMDAGAFKLGVGAQDLILDDLAFFTTLGASDLADLADAQEEGKVLFFEPWGSTIAPFGIDAAPNYNCRKLKVRRSREQYRNRQYIRAARDITNSRTESFVGDGTRKTFNVGFPVAEVPSITVNGVSKTVGVRGVDIARDWYWNKDSTEVSQDDAAFALSSLTTLAITYRGFFPIIVAADADAEIADRAAAEGNSGRYENIQDDQTIETQAVAIDLANGLLAKYPIPEVVTFETFRRGLMPGQLIPIVDTGYGLNGYYLIQTVGGRIEDGRILWTVTALSGEGVDTWMRFFKKIFAARRQVAIRENEVLLLLRQSTLPVTCTDALAISIAGPESRIGFATIGFSEIA